jgi:Glycosyltransferase family 87
MLESASQAGLRVMLSRVAWPASVVFCGVLPVATLVALFIGAVQDGAVAMDFQQFYRGAEAILEDGSPYSTDVGSLWGGPYPYPPLPAMAAIPLTLLPLQAAELLVMAVLVAVALAVPWVLGVRDWRCYGLVLLWPPVISAIQTGNVTLWFALASALAWRYRDRLIPVAAVIGITLATKFFLWPLVAWLAATRRYLSAALTCAIGAGLLLLSWAAIGFSGLRDYPDLLRRLEGVIGDDSYTAYIVALDLGASPTVARAIWLGLGIALLAAIVLVARRGDERSAFILAIAAALALTPIVWLHYFALLLVVVAVAQPRLGLVWFLPLAMFVTPGSGHPTPFETLATLVVAALTIVLALRASVQVVGTAESERRVVPPRTPAHAS